jgi:RNA polymerase sigma-70 factor, ECF subfamily
MQDAIRAAAQGDEEAMRTVWRAHQPLLLRYLRSRLGTDDAQDVAQQVWVETARALARFEGSVEDFRRFLFAIGRRRMIDELRRRERRGPMLLTDTVPEQAANTNFDAADDLARAVQLVRRLPTDQADAVLLRIIADLDVVNVATIMEKSEGNVRVLVHRGLARLAVFLQEEKQQTFDRSVTSDVSPTMNELR